MYKSMGSIFSFCIAFLMLNVMFATASEEAKKSPIKVGGAMRVNYVYGSYGDEENPLPRGEKIGDVDLEIFRLNADLNYKNLIGRIEYRWYNVYSMIHTGWLGYKLDSLGSIKAGIVRVPFGPTPYGISTSWFFDQHFYVGLADDMDLGVRWTSTFDKLTFAFQSWPKCLVKTLDSPPILKG